MSISKRGDRYVVRVDGERNAAGRRKRFFVGTYLRKIDAQKAERAAKTQRDHGVDLSPVTMTVQGLFTAYFLARRSELAEKTYERYEELARLHILAHHGSALIVKLKPFAISGLYVELRTKLSPQSVKHVDTLYRSAFAWAEARELLVRSPFRSVERPVVRSAEQRVLNGDEVLTLLGAAEGTRWHTAFAFALGTAARRGEVCGLKWSDVDLEARTVTIRSSLSDANHRLTLKAPKSGRIRRFTLSVIALEALRSRRREAARERLAAGPSYIGDLTSGYVFADALGAAMVPDALTKAFSRIAKGAEIEGATLHALRHSAATFMLANGAAIHSVQAILGHSVPSTTLNIYGHAMGDMESKAVSVIDEHLAAARQRRGA